MAIRRRSSLEEISAASMSDIAFLLLVFFMVASVFYVKEGLLTTLPKKDSSPKLVLKKDVYQFKLIGNEVIVSNVSIGNKKYTDLEDFKENLKNLEIPNIQEKYAVLSATDTKVQNMVTVLSEVKNKGFKNISIQKFLK